MKALKVLAVAFLTSLFLGCISSLNPLFTEKELIFNPDLLGDWSDGETKLSFTREGEKGYLFNTSWDEEEYKTHLVKLDNNTYLDIYLLDTLNNGLSDPTSFSGHYFYKIEIKKVEIILSLIDDALVDSLINDSGGQMPYKESKDGWLLLTASTEKLQKFFRENENLFTYPRVYKKYK